MPAGQLSEDPGARLEDYSPAETYKPTRRDERLAEKLEKRFMDAYNARSTTSNKWELYHLYLKGEPLLVNNTTGEILRLAPEDAGNLKSNDNVLRPTHRSFVGKFTRDIEMAEVVPATDDFEEQHGALVGTAWLRWFFEKEALEVIYTEAIENLSYTGSGFLYLDWDFEAGPKRGYCEVCSYVGQPKEIGHDCPNCALQRQNELMIQDELHQANIDNALADVLESLPPGTMPSEDMIPEDALQPPELEQTGPLSPDMDPPQLEEIHTGLPRLQCLDPESVFPEPGASCLEKAGWFVTRDTVSVSKARNLYPRFAPFITANTSIYSDRTAEIRFHSVETDETAEYLHDHCWIRKFHERPTPGYPNGRIITMINNYVVEEKENVYWKLFGRWNLFHFRGDENRGEFWPESWIQNAWHRQKELNENEQSIREYVTLCTKQKVLNPFGSKITADEITAETAQVIKYNPNAGEVHFLSPPPLSADVWRRSQDLTMSMRDKAGVTAQEAGEMGSDPNGRAMAIVEAEADQQHGPILRKIKKEWRMAQKCALILFQAFTDPETKWTIVGRDGVQTYSFDELMLKEGWDVRIQDATGLPHNKALRQQIASDWWNMGIFMDEKTGLNDKKAWARLAGVNLPMSGYNMEATERAAASRIPYEMLKGKVHQPQFEDDPEIFAEVLNGWLRGPGRRDEVDANITQQIRALWQFYTYWYVAGQMGQPPPGPILQTLQQGQMGGGPSDQSGAGGSANGPGHMGSDIRAQAGATVQRADRGAESGARTTPKREG